MGKLSRDKGAQWERDVANLLAAASGSVVNRTLTECRDGNSGDVTCPGLPLVVQCKVGGRPDIYGAVQEAKEVADPKALHPVAIVKRNGAGARPPDTLAVMPLSDFLEIVGLLKAGGLW